MNGSKYLHVINFVDLALILIYVHAKCFVFDLWGVKIFSGS
jgi:hypothetical protein